MMSFFEPVSLGPWVINAVILMGGMLAFIALFCVCAYIVERWRGYL